MSPTAEDVDQIIKAVAVGVSGNRPGALVHLKPIIDRGPGDVFAMLHALANIALVDQPRIPGTFIGLGVETTDGRPADIGEVPAGLRFAAQFTAACANGDTAQAGALYKALLRGSEHQVADNISAAVAAVYDMAVVTTASMALKARRKNGRT